MGPQRQALRVLGNWMRSMVRNIHALLMRMQACITATQGVLEGVNPTTKVGQVLASRARGRHVRVGVFARKFAGLGARSALPVPASSASSCGAGDTGW